MKAIEGSKYQILLDCLSDHQKSLFEASQIGFLGQKKKIGGESWLALYPTTFGPFYWLWRIVDFAVEPTHEMYSETPGYIYDLPLEWFINFILCPRDFEPKEILIPSKRNGLNNNDHVIIKYNEKPIKKYNFSDHEESERKSFEEAGHLTNIYFLQAGENGPIKIGRSVDIERRIDEIQPKCPYKLNLIHALYGVNSNKEKELHYKFRQFHLHYEWFSPEIYDEIFGC